MSTTTAVHSLRKAAGGDSPSIANAMLGFDDVDAILPVVQTGTPTKKPGLVWTNPSTLKTQITDGTTWYPISDDTSVCHRFFGSIQTANTAIAANTNIDFGTPVEDTASAWNTSTHLWTCPAAGTYLWAAELKCNSTPAPPVIQLRKNGAAFFLGPAVASAAYAGQAQSGYLRLAAGDTVALGSVAAFATMSDSPAHNNFLQIIRIGIN